VVEIMPTTDKTYKVLEQLAPIVQHATVGRLDADGYYLFTLKAAFTKNFEFVSSVFASEQANSAFLVCPFLRGLCEDIILLRDLLRFSREDRDRVVLLLSTEQTFRFVDKQLAFFSEYRPTQQVVGHSPSPMNSAAPTDRSKQLSAQIEALRGAYGPARVNVRDMAQRSSLLHLYDYLYCATSSFVHFSPRNLHRMGWGDERARVFEFSTRNFGDYYKDFCRFYGIFLFVTFCAMFGSMLSVRSEISERVEALMDDLTNVNRWPELVTFEEMNWSRLRPSEVLTSPFSAVGNPSGRAKRPSFWEWA
jgi:hypothetical protein